MKSLLPCLFLASAFLASGHAAAQSAAVIEGRIEVGATAPVGMVEEAELSLLLEREIFPGPKKRAGPQ
jgi:hypothetical protein